jgi:hypothetical protein
MAAVWWRTEEQRRSRNRSRAEEGRDQSGMAGREGVTGEWLTGGKRKIERGRRKTEEWVAR